MKSLKIATHTRDSIIFPMLLLNFREVTFIKTPGMPAKQHKVLLHY
jgi:hypothetical protein